VISGKIEMVKEKGKDIEKIHPLESDDFQMEVMETDAEDVEMIEPEVGSDDSVLGRVVTAREDFASVLSHFED